MKTDTVNAEASGLLVSGVVQAQKTLNPTIPIMHLAAWSVFTSLEAVFDG